MKLAIGSNYSVLFKDGSVVTFTFLGGNNAEIQIKGKKSELIKLLDKPYLSYWEIESLDPFEV